MAVKKSGVGSVKLPTQKTPKGKKASPRKTSSTGAKTQKKVQTKVKAMKKPPKDTRYKGGVRKEATLSWATEDYSPRNLAKRDIKEVKKEYSRIRSILRKRLERMEGTEWEKSEYYKKHKDGFKTLKEIKSDRELFYELNKLAKTLVSQKSSIGGLEKEREHFLEVMNSKDSAYRGIVNEDNYWDFIEYMKALEEMGIKYQYDSKRELEYFKENRKEIKKMIDDKEKLDEHFKNWLKKKDARYVKYIDNRGNSGSKARDLFRKNKGE